MNKTVLGVAMVVVFCITWWIVAGEAWQAVEPAKQANEQAWQAETQPKETYEQAMQALEQVVQAARQAEQAFIMADAHWRTQASWGIGAGLLADVLLLVGALAWSKLTAKA